MIHRLCLDRIGVDHRPAGIAERMVHRVGQGVDARRPLVAGKDDAGAGVGAQVADEGIQPFFGHGMSRRKRIQGFQFVVQPRRHRPRESFDLPGPQRPAVVRFGAGDARSGFDHVQAIHRRRSVFCRPGPQPAFGGELPHISQMSGPTRQEIGIEREDHVGPIKPVIGIDILAEGPACALANRVAINRLVLMPFRPGKPFEQ